MATRKKIGTRTLVVHECSQQEVLKRHGEVLDRISTVTLGNGHPEDGLLFLFRAFLKNQTEMEGNIKEIKAKVEEALGASGKAQKAIEIYKAEMDGVVKGKDEITQKEKDRFEKNIIAENLKLTRARDSRFVIFSIIGTILTFITIVVAIYFGNKRFKEVDNRVNNLGTPYIANPRGVPIDSVTVKMWPKDFVGKDTIN